MFSYRFIYVIDTIFSFNHIFCLTRETGRAVIILQLVTWQVFGITAAEQNKKDVFALINMLDCNSGKPVVLVEDDGDDRDIFIDTLHALGFANPCRTFANGIELLDYMLTTKEKPLLIYCDINMPLMDGFRAREEILRNDFLRQKSIPFIFFSTDGSVETVNKAYALMVQGFFKKPSTMDELNRLLKLSIEYWCACLHPNAF